MAFDYFSDNKVIYGWLYFDVNAQAELHDKCVADNADYAVDQ
jgi:hypothetical protein